MTANTQADSNRDNKGLFIAGNKPKVGFHTNPERRGKGFWKREDTLRYKIEKASFLSTAELKEIADDPAESALLRKFAEATVKADWRMIKEITEMLYGKPKESVDVTTQGESINAYSALSAEELRNLAGK